MFAVSKIKVALAVSAAGLGLVLSACSGPSAGASQQDPSRVTNTTTAKEQGVAPLPEESGTELNWAGQDYLDDECNMLNGKVDPVVQDKVPVGMTQVIFWDHSAPNREGGQQVTQDCVSAKVMAERKAEVQQQMAPYKKALDKSLSSVAHRTPDGLIRAAMAYTCGARNPKEAYYRFQAAYTFSAQYLPKSSWVHKKDSFGRPYRIEYVRGSLSDELCAGSPTYGWYTEYAGVESHISNQLR